MDLFSVIRGQELFSNLWRKHQQLSERLFQRAQEQRLISHIMVCLCRKGAWLNANLMLDKSSIPDRWIGIVLIIDRHWYGSKQTFFLKVPFSMALRPCYILLMGYPIHTFGMRIYLISLSRFYLSRIPPVQTLGLDWNETKQEHTEPHRGTNAPWLRGIWRRTTRSCLRGQGEICCCHFYRFWINSWLNHPIFFLSTGSVPILYLLWS